MDTIAQVSTAMQTVLTTAAETADAQLHYPKRPDRAKFSASTLVQTLVLGWLAHPDATVEQLAQSAARVGGAASPQAIDQRFTPATAALLQSVLGAAMQQAIRRDGVAIPIFQRFTGVRVHDGATSALPDALATQWAGGGGSSPRGTRAALKCGVHLDLLTGAVTARDLASGRAHDGALPCQHAELPAGRLRLADLGFYTLQRLAELDRAQVSFLSKVRATTTVGLDEHTRQALTTFITQHAASGYDDWGWIGTAHPLRARLLVQAVPQEVADQRRRRIRREAREKGQTPSAAAVLLAGWTILITNAPPELLTLAAALVVARARWQIELLFKLWKSHGQIATWPTHKPERILSEVYATLLAMVLHHWMVLVGCWQ